jgi:hypothetical protein
MFLLGGTFRCVVDGVAMFFMGGPVTSHMARLATFSVGGLGVFLSAGVVDMFLLGGMFWCAVDGVIKSFMGGLVAYHIRACQFGQ